GGMNRRQAGEDFYFLHKVFPLENFSEITSTKVIPSPRLSDRVPFGTGADITKQMINESEAYLSYNPKSFYNLKVFFDLIPHLYSGKEQSILLEKLPDSVITFLKQEHFEKKLTELREHTASQKAFVKRFYKWFDGFKLLKYIHFARDQFHPQVKLSEAVHDLLNKMEIQSSTLDEKKLLLKLRKIELEKSYAIGHKNKQEKHPP
ncbi:MAG: glycosyltransferase family 2 protein, partial [Bacteroidia bacterium]